MQLQRLRPGRMRKTSKFPSFVLLQKQPLPTTPFRHFPRPFSSFSITAQSASSKPASPSPSTSPSSPSSNGSTNPALSFPCLDRLEQRTQDLSQSGSKLTIKPNSFSGPEPSYTSGKHQTFECKSPILLDWGGILPSFTIAYETWGSLNSDKSNVILLHTGLSASSHAHSTADNPQPGWWEKFIGPGKPLDTDRYHVICTNVIGGCYGSTGPSSVDPANGQQYGTRFPIITMEDMVRAQFRLLDHLGIEKVYASVGSSMGGMQSLASGILFPGRVGKIVSISGCARSHPYSIALRHTQRQVLMMDPNWARGFYYSSIPPHAGMKLAREIATVTYRGGPEWERRFGRRRADPARPPALCPDFLIETYLDHAGEKWCLEYDPNSLLYISKAMDLFDLGAEAQALLAGQRDRNGPKFEEFVDRWEARIRRGQRDVLTDGEANGDTWSSGNEQGDSLCTLSLPDTPYHETGSGEGEEGTIDPSHPNSIATSNTPRPSSSDTHDAPRPSQDLITGLSPLKHIPALVLGVRTDILFPAWQQREIVDALRAAGNGQVVHVELDEGQSIFGHDTFLLDLENVGGNVSRFLD